MRILKTIGSSVARNSKADSRSGAATLELAVSAPLLVILVFGAIEMANAVFLKQTVNLAAYEASKIITRPGTNQTLAQTRVAEIMTARRVTNYSLSFSPAVTTATPRGTQVTVTLSAPASNLSYGPLRFMTGKTVTAVVKTVPLCFSTIEPFTSKLEVDPGTVILRENFDENPGS